MLENTLTNIILEEYYYKKTPSYSQQILNAFSKLREGERQLLEAKNNEESSKAQFEIKEANIRIYQLNNQIIPKCSFFPTAGLIDIEELEEMLRVSKEEIKNKPLYSALRRGIGNIFFNLKINIKI